MRWLCVSIFLAALLAKSIGENVQRETNPALFELFSRGSTRLLNSEKNEEDFEELLKKALEAFKGVMKTGYPQYGIPILDPWIIKKPFNVNTKSLQLKGEFYAEVYNMSNFVVNAIHADMDLNAALNFTLNDVAMIGKYSMDGSAMSIIPLMGNGEHHLSFNQLNLAIQPDLIAKDGFLKLSDCHLSFYEDDLEIFIQGLFEGSDVSNLLAYFFKDLFSALLGKHNQQVTVLLNDYLVKSFNNDGRGMNIYDIIETVKRLA